MERKFESIIKDGLKAGKSYDEINKLLAEAGANFHLDPEKLTNGWTEQEMLEGFIQPNEPAGKAQRELDKSRHEEFANTTQIQWIPGGKYEVTYDERGYFKKAIKIG